jgi:cell division transport system permease protein
MATAKRLQPLAKPNLVTRVRAYARDHLRGLIFSLGKLYRKPFATTLTLLMVATALALPACLYVLLNNLQSVSHKWDNAGQITLFLHVDTHEDVIKKLRARLHSHPQIEAVEYMSANEALKKFRQRDEFNQLLDGLQANPLPPTLILTPVTPEKQAVGQLVNELQSFPNVEFVQLDLQWLQRLQAIIHIIRRTITVIGLMLAASVLLVVGNSIRLDIENRREEIEVIKLIGATDRFIRRPFLYGGMWYGLLGGILALLLVLIMLLLIKQPAQNLVGLYNSNFQLMLPSFTQGLGLITSSIGLGLLGSWLAVSRHITKIEPT